MNPPKVAIPTQAGPMSVAPDPAAAIAAFRANARSPNGPAFSLIEPHLPQILSAIIKGSLVPGPGGHSDRMTLFRMIGVPWTPSGRTSQASDLDTSSASRLTAALARIENRLSGRMPVTLDAEPSPTPRQLGSQQRSDER